MKRILLTTAFALMAMPALATDCKRQGGGYMCGGNTYIDGSKASDAEAANALAAQLQAQSQDQDQSQRQSQSSSTSQRNAISINDSDESVSLATPAGGACSWGVNIAVPGEGGFGVCGTTRNQTAAALAQIADSIGNPCAAENQLAVAALLNAPMLRDVELTCN